MAVVYSWEFNNGSFGYIVNPDNDKEPLIKSEALEGEDLEKVKKWADGIDPYKPEDREKYIDSFKKLEVLAASNDIRNGFLNPYEYMFMDDDCDNLRGRRGDKGDRGNTGEDGDNGMTPTAKRAEDGYLYWAWKENGEWIKDEFGNRLPVSGEKGERGKDGKPGIYDNTIYLKSTEPVEFKLGVNWPEPSDWWKNETYQNTDKYASKMNKVSSVSWTDVPSGVGNEYRYEYVSSRKKYRIGDNPDIESRDGFIAGKDGTYWGEFSKPVIWSSMGPKGEGGASGIPGTKFKTYFTLGHFSLERDASGNPVSALELYSPYTKGYYRWNKKNSFTLDYPETVGMTRSIPSVSDAPASSKEDKYSVFFTQAVINFDDDGNEIMEDEYWSEPSPYDGRSTGKQISSPIVYPAGMYDVNKEYRATETTVPYVYYDKKYYKLNLWYWKGNDGSIGNAMATPENSPWAWEKITSFDMIYSDIGIFNSALVGPAVFWENYMYSQNGINPKTKENVSNFKDFNCKDPYSNDSKFWPNVCIDFRNGTVWASRGNVKFSKDGTTSIGGSATIDGDTRIGGNTTIEGKTTLRDGLTLDGTFIVRDKSKDTGDNNEADIVSVINGNDESKYMRVPIIYQDKSIGDIDGNINKPQRIVFASGLLNGLKDTVNVKVFKWQVPDESVSGTFIGNNNEIISKNEIYTIVNYNEVDDENNGIYLNKGNDKKIINDSFELVTVTKKGSNGIEVTESHLEKITDVCRLRTIKKYEETTYTPREDGSYAVNTIPSENYENVKIARDFKFENETKEIIYSQIDAEGQILPIKADELESIENGSTIIFENGLLQTSSLYASNGYFHGEADINGRFKGTADIKGGNIKNANIIDSTIKGNISLDSGNTFQMFGKGQDKVISISNTEIKADSSTIFSNIGMSPMEFKHSGKSYRENVGGGMNVPHLLASIPVSENCMFNIPEITPFATEYVPRKSEINNPYAQCHFEVVFTDTDNGWKKSFLNINGNKYSTTFHPQMQKEKVDRHRVNFHGFKLSGDSSYENGLNIKTLSDETNHNLYEVDSGTKIGKWTGPNGYLAIYFYVNLYMMTNQGRDLASGRIYCNTSSSTIAVTKSGVKGTEIGSNGVKIASTATTSISIVDDTILLKCGENSIKIDADGVWINNKQI